MSRYHHVDAMKAEGFPVSAACAAAEISTSAYYEWRDRQQHGPSEAELAEAALVEQIRQIHAESDGTYGSPRVTEELRRRGWHVNEKRVERLMAIHEIVGVSPRRFVRTTLPAEENPPLPDLLERRFSPREPDFAWAGDITYVPTGEGWLYVASVLDLGSRRLVGYAMEDNMATPLVAGALERAVELRDGAHSVICHSDRGSQYLSRDYRKLCERLGIRQSVACVGTCFDNSVAEAFWAALKRELVHRYRFATRAEVKAAITAWFKRYNNVRLHSSLNYLPPIEWEMRYRLRELHAA